jgi:hypothetical protein
MSDVEHCPSCGQKIRKLNTHRMDFSKVRLLIQIATMNLKYEWVKVQRDGNLIKFEERDRTIQVDDVHALRLTWFGLLERKAFRSGLYRVTTKGISFLGGYSFVPAQILCRNGVVVERADELVSIGEVKGVVLDKAYWDDYAAIQKPVDNGGRLF